MVEIKVRKDKPGMYDIVVNNRHLLTRYTYAAAIKVAEDLLYAINVTDGVKLVVEGNALRSD